MQDPTTIALNLTFLGTLGVALVMFLGLFLCFVATLLIAGTGRLLAAAIFALAGILGLTPGRTRPAGTGRGGAGAKAPYRAPAGAAAKAPAPAGRPAKDARPQPAMSPNWVAAVALADERAAARAAARAHPPVRVTAREVAGPGAPAAGITAVSALVASATDCGPASPPRTFQKPSAPTAPDLLNTGSLVSLAGRFPLAAERVPSVKGPVPAPERKAG